MDAEELTLLIIIGWIVCGAVGYALLRSIDDASHSVMANVGGCILGPLTLILAFSLWRKHGR